MWRCTFFRMCFNVYPASPAHVRWMTTALVLTIVVSLAFDITDVIRYVLGEHASLVPAG